VELSTARDLILKSAHHDWTFQLPSHLDLQTMKSSADRIVDGNICHLCALIFHSLKGRAVAGANGENVGISDGLVELEIRCASENLTMVPRIGSCVGYPLQPSIGGGKLSPLDSFCGHLNIRKRSFVIA
jgi:hypothetical protein